MSNTLIVDRAPGEIRAGLFNDVGEVTALFVDRASDSAQRAQAGAIYCGRVRAIEPSLNAAFVDLGVGAPGFMPLGKEREQTSLFEGAAVIVRVRREAFSEKGPLLLQTQKEKDCTRLLCPSLLSPAPDFIERINPKNLPVRDATREDRETLDAAFDAALNPLVVLPGGGEVMIEQTRAMVAVDIDTAADKRRALEVNIEAIPAIFKTLALRGLAGIVAIDFAPMKGAKERKKLEAALSKVTAAHTAQIELAPLNRFGVLVLTVKRNQRPLAETMLDATGKISTATTALIALRRVENEHRANPASALTLRATPAIIIWLKSHEQFWAEPLLSRLGGRLKLEEAPTLDDDRFEVIAT
jgi:Ribonuclease G/E